MRGAPAFGGQADDDAPAVGLGFQRQEHFLGYVIPLCEDTEALRMTFAKKSIRQTISKSKKLGVEVRRGEGDGDLRRFYRLYALNRKRHGIPPQPYGLFRRVFDSMAGGSGARPEARLYLAQYEGQCVAALVVFRHRGVAYAKYEGVDDTYRRVLPVNPMLWRSIQDACAAGDRFYNFGRTAVDNSGLNEFKSRWGTRREPLPYFVHPPRESLSVVKSDSLKYRLFTGAFRRMPLGLSVRMGERLFRHFG
jgi:lipid II:glycine glycyltransferase (peptidoglycan interpeptide bridge formation enzyme)